MVNCQNIFFKCEYILFYVILIEKKTLNTYHLNLKNLVRIGTNNASVMTGVNSGVHQKLKIEVPQLILIKCLCHYI
jgi:hypothetical protein